MRPFKAATALILVSALSASTGCKRVDRETASPEDYFPLIIAGLELGKTGAMIGRNEAIKKKNFAGCVTADVLASAFASAEDSLTDKLAGKITIPAFDLDLADCMKFNPHEPKSKEEIAEIVDVVAGAALTVSEIYAAKLKKTDCKKGVAALGAIAWIRGLIPAIVSEIENPDGKFNVPAHTIDLSVCE